MTEADPIDVGGPYFDELAVGQVFDTAPSMTLTSGAAAMHQAILGDRLRLPLDAHLSAEITGRSAELAHPGLVCDIAIGQSTLATHHVKANLFYRGLRFHLFPHIGDSLDTRTEVVGLKANTVKPGRRPTGLVALRMETVDQTGRKILDFYRCAMIPFSDSPRDGSESAADDLSAIGPADEPVYGIPEGWDLSGMPTTSTDLAGTVFSSSADVVSSAPELARLTLNIAATHHDSRVNGGSRLVYGGHTIGIALSQATRALPNLVTVLGWQSCDHLGPVREGDTITSRLHVESAETIDGGAMLLRLRSIAEVVGGQDGAVPVLDWRFTALAAGG
ncbi:acyl dehydratase [Williamsia limnetica]|uniref:Acyl dehydratase n=1 Tax=Williamsia limnetica TaxID=882452 RepID=A0A318RF52_WILLI|nr:MaoC family dehydratase [Williamsia limnetica]PYE12906.1 acyl dehydratase [Williamsia limnetica]